MLPSSHTVRVDSHHRIELVLPDVPEGVLVNVRVEPLANSGKEAPREPGSARGRMQILPEFDDPIEEFEPYRQ